MMFIDDGGYDFRDLEDDCWYEQPSFFWIPDSIAFDGEHGQIWKFR